VFNKESDERLLQRAGRGDEAAFVEVYQRHRQTVFGFAFRLLGSVEIAEDITHDCFLSLIKNTERFDATKASLKTYLLAAARNLAAKHFHKTNGNICFEDLTEEPFLSENNLPLKRLLDEELTLIVQDAIAQLSPLQREALILFEYEELSHTEISKVVGEEVNVIKQRLHRARMSLKKILAPYIESENKYQVKSKK
jgi:RNA polymerase sigma-70 factor (ECF subfamily)